MRAPGLAPSLGATPKERSYVMTTLVENAVTRMVPPSDRRSWLRWGSAVFVCVETVHFVGGTLVNDWEGWGTFLQVLAFVLVTGLVIVGLTYGLLVRWGLKPSPRGRNRPALAGLAAGVLSVASYAAFFMWAPVLIAPGAVLLGRVGLARAQDGQGGRAYAAAGAFLGLSSLAVFLAMALYAAFHHGNYPFGF
jgi:hypothetical protein